MGYITLSSAPPSFDGKKKIDEQNEISVPTVQAFMSSVVVRTVLCYDAQMIHQTSSSIMDIENVLLPFGPSIKYVSTLFVILTLLFPMSALFLYLSVINCFPQFLTPPPPPPFSLWTPLKKVLYERPL